MKMRFNIVVVASMVLWLPLVANAAVRPAFPTIPMSDSTVTNDFGLSPEGNYATVENQPKGFFKRLGAKVESITKRKIGVAIVSIITGALVVSLFGWLVVYSGLPWIIMLSAILVGLGLYWGGRGMKYFFKNKGEVADNPKKSKRRKMLLFLAGVVVTSALAVLIALLVQNADLCFMCL